MGVMPREFYEQFKKADGSIDFGRAASAWVEKEVLLIDNLSLKKKPKSVEELSVFKLADEVSDDVWSIVAKWDWFSKKTVGGQWVRATDSIVANITEGYGRYFFGEYLVFLYFARGSVYESMLWLNKAHKRKLLINNHLSLSNDKMFNELKPKFDKLPVEINKVVKIVKGQARKWKGKPRY